MKIKNLILPTILALSLVSGLTYIQIRESTPSNVKQKESQPTVLKRNPETSWYEIEDESTLIIDKLAGEYVELTDKTKILYYEGDKGIFEKELESGIETPIIELSENQTIVYSMSPNKRYLVYTIANHIKDGGQNILEEGALTLLDLNTNETKFISHVPNGKTFSGIYRWAEDSSYFYHVLRSSNENLHFPDPETTEFYEVDLLSLSPTYLLKSSDMDSSHIGIRAEDEKHLYFVSEGHGEYHLRGVWKYNKESGVITNVFSYTNSDMDTDNIYYLTHFDLDNERLLVRVHYPEEGGKYSQGYSHISLQDGKVTPTRIKLSNESIHYLGNIDNVFYLKQYNQQNGTIKAYDNKTGELVEEIDPVPERDVDFFASFDENKTKLIMSLIDHKDPSLKQILAVYDLKTKETKYVNYYSIGRPKNIITVVQ